MLTSWDGIGAGLRRREIAATWAWRLLSIWVVVSVAAVPVVESEDTVGWLLCWVGGPCDQLLGNWGLMEAVGLGGGLLCPGCFLDLVFRWRRSESGIGVGRMWLAS